MPDARVHVHVCVDCVFVHVCARACLLQYQNTQQEIRQAFADYQKTQFGGWPWDEDAVVFPRDKGRFALLDGVETNPPQ